MKATVILICCLFLAMISVVNANQQIIAKKGQFDVFPESPLRESKLNVKAQKGNRFLVWSTGFVSETGWNVGGIWQMGSPSMGPQSVPEGNTCLGTNLSGFYPNSANVTAISPLIQIPFASYVELSFQEWFELESDYDFGYVEVHCDNNTSRIDARSGTSANLWRNTALNITQFQGRSIRLAFHLVTDATVPATGWYLDNMNINAVEPLPMELNVSGINISNLPSVYLTASVNSPSGPITDLEPANFSIYENSVEQQNNFAVITPDDEELVSSADIVFVLDVTGSMSDEINSVRANMQSFMSQLDTQNIDYRIGFVVYGDIVYVYNQYMFYTEYQEIMSIINNISLGEHGIGSGGDGPENQMEAMAEGSIFNWRPGASRVMIMLTDASAHEADGVTPWTGGDLLAQRLIPNNVVVFPIFNVSNAVSVSQYLPIAQETNPMGTYYYIYDNFNAIINEIGNYISSLYTVHYTSSVNINDPMSRIVKLVASAGNNSSEDYAFYLPGISPIIHRQPSLQVLDQNSVPASTSLNLDVSISDRVAPSLQSANLLWRRSGTQNYSSLTLTPIAAGLYRATIPAGQVTGIGLEYYIVASDGQTSNTLPSSEPLDKPFSIAISPQHHTIFSSEVATYNPTSGFHLSLHATASQSLSLILNYRPMGSLVYNSTPMILSGTNTFTAFADEDLGNLGVQYYVVATQNNQLRTNHGNFDAPLYVQNAPTPVIVNEALPQIEFCEVYPNPVGIKGKGDGAVRIGFSLAEQCETSVALYNIKGQLVRNLANKPMSGGEHTISWDLTDSNGSSVSSGLYFVRIQTPNKSKTGKILIT
ncbi:MAG: VWA domain-containing protein, partial [Candidatus Cloacimonetes bacterium]|nr:VWA domain-containing protein [Candidatus Cloacimonadota bacterium]